MKGAAFVCCTVALVLGACAGRDPGAVDPGGSVDSGGSGKDTVTLKTVAGSYPLATVDSLALPCCATRDSTGDVVTILRGTLTLEEAAPEDFVFTPSGYVMAKSCVHQIPNGAVVDTGGVVRLPDGTSYRLPECGDAPYRLTLTEQHQRAGVTRNVVVSDSGKYVWGHGYLTLVGKGTVPTRIGDITASASAVHISVQHYESFPPSPRGHRFEFTGGR